MKELIDWIGELTAGGDREGLPFLVLPWQKKFIRGAFSQDGPASLSISRGNGKSALIAAICTAALDPEGPLHRRRAETVIVASSFNQGLICFEDVVYFMREKGHNLENRKIWKLENSANRAQLMHKPSGARIRAIGSCPKKAHGMRPTYCALDEPSQWDASKRDAMFGVIKTGLGKVPNSKMFVLGTRPSDSTHFFGKLLDGGSGYSQVHSAPLDGNPFSMASINAANPSLSIMPSLKAEILTEAEEAKRDTSALATFRALRLNQGTSETVRQHLLQAETWANSEVDSGALDVADSFVLGVDLGGAQSMTACAAYWPETGRLEVLGMFPCTPEFDLRKRGIRDGIGELLYKQMEAEGDLIAYQANWIPAKALLLEAKNRWGFARAVVADRWRADELRQGLQEAKYPLCPFQLRGMGFYHGSEDVRGFHQAFLTGKVRPIKSLLMRKAMSEAVLVTDAAGNSKLAKSTQGGRRRNARDDVVAAAILAVAAGTRQEAKPKPRPLRWAIAR